MNGKKDQFTSSIFAKLLVPAMISSYGWAVSDMADAVVVGQRMGTTGLAAIGFILPVYMVNYTIAHGFGIGGAVSFSLLLSKGRHQDAGLNFNNVLLSVTLIGVLLALAGNVFVNELLFLLGVTEEGSTLYYATKDYLVILLFSTPVFFISTIVNYYLRNDEHEKCAGIGSVAGNVTDLVLNFVFVFGMGMGTAGAALATFLGEILSVMIYLPWITRYSHVAQLRLRKVDWRDTAVCFVRGFSVSIQYLYQLFFYLIMNNILVRLSGESGVAVFDLIQNTSYLIYYAYEGTVRAMQPLLSTYCGEYNEAGEKQVLRLGIRSGVLTGGVIAVAVIIAPQIICRLFGVTNPEIYEMAQVALRAFAAGSFVAGMNILLCNYYQAKSEARASFIAETLRGAVILFPVLGILSAFGLPALWFVYPMTEIGALAVFVLLRSTGLLNIRQFDQNRICQLFIQNTEQELNTLLSKMELFCNQWGATAQQIYFAQMSVEEICLAIIQHSKKGNHLYIQVTMIATDNGDFELHLRDNETSFNPFALADAEAGAEINLDAMGMLVIQKKAKKYYYRRYHNFNTLVLTI